MTKFIGNNWLYIVTKSTNPNVCTPGQCRAESSFAREVRSSLQLLTKSQGKLSRKNLFAGIEYNNSTSGFKTELSVGGAATVVLLLSGLGALGND